jgi:ZIP family zinc transporter
MSEPSAPVRASWHAGFYPVKSRGWLGLFFWSTLVGITVLLLISGYSAFTGANRVNLHYALAGGLCGFGATALGAVAAVILRDITARTQDTLLGFAAGMMLAASSFSLILPGIAIQDIPEGLAVALALRVTGLSTLRAALIAVGSGLMEPLGAVVGLGISTSFALGYPVALGLAAGAMIFVVSHEVIPETHRNGHQTPATLGLMLGFAVMMFLDTALG